MKFNRYVIYTLIIFVLGSLNICLYSNVSSELETLNCKLIGLKSSLKTLHEKLDKLGVSLGGEGGLKSKLVSLIAKSIYKHDEFLASNRLIGGINLKNGDLHSIKSIDGVKFYDVKVLSQTISYPKSTHFRRLYGCGFHSLKNVLFLTKIIIKKDNNTFDNSDLTNQKKFLDLFEKNSEKPFSWYYVWKKYREKNKINFKPLDDPPTQDYDLENIKAKIIAGTAVAPKLGKKIIRYTNIIEYIDGDKLEKTPLIDALKMVELSEVFRNSQSIVLPFITAYTHSYATSKQCANKQYPEIYGKFGRHWIAIVVNKFKGKIEVLYGDAWRNSSYKHKNLSSAKRVLEWLTKTSDTIKAYFDVLVKERNKDKNRLEKLSSDISNKIGNIKLAKKALDKKMNDFESAVNKIVVLKKNLVVKLFKKRFLELLEWYKNNNKDKKLKNRFESMLAKISKKNPIKFN